MLNCFFVGGGGGVLVLQPKDQLILNFAIYFWFISNSFFFLLIFELSGFWFLPYELTV